MKHLIRFLGFAFFTTLLMAYANQIPVFAAYDVIPPKINSVTLNKTTMKKPGTVTFTMDITEEGSGIEGIVLSIINPNSKSGLSSVNESLSFDIPKYSNKFTMTIAIPTALETGECYITINVWDCLRNNNSYTQNVIYDYNHDNWTASIIDKNKLYVLDKACIDLNNSIPISGTLMIEDEFNIALEAWIGNPSLTNQIIDMKEEETALIHYNAKLCTAKKEIFDAIKGTNKTIIFDEDGKQWIFNGKDIVHLTKDINLSIALKKISSKLYGVNANAIQLDFSSNGILPGKTQIRLKSDYLYNEYSLTEKMYLYYMDDNEIEKENKDVEIMLDGKDRWCIMEISHNSSFIISKAQLSQPIVKGKVYAIGDLKYKINNDNIYGKGTVSVDGVVKKDIKTLNIPNVVKINNINFNVISIEPKAFISCTKLKNIKIGSKVLKIGSKAFYGCASLLKVTGCTSVTNIGEQSFLNCKKLTTIGSKNNQVLFAKVINIGKQAFEGCVSITNVNITSSSLKSINDSAFSGCLNLRTVKITSLKLQTIGSKAFYKDSKLSLLSFKSKLLTDKKIGKKAFSGINSICKFKVPKSKIDMYKKIFINKGANKKIKVTG